MKVLNLTQHLATPEQIAAGVVEPAIDAKKQLVSLLTFEQLPTAAEIRSRAYDIAAVARSQYVTEPTEGVRFTHAMIGGAPYLMGPLEIALRASQITPVYAFSVRESVDEVQPDGSVRKVAVFRHVGFVGLDQEIESDEPETLSEEKCARYRDLAASHLTATKDHMNPSFPAQFARLSILYRAGNLAADRVQAAAAALPVNSPERRAEQDRYGVLLGLLNALQIEIDAMTVSVAAEVLADPETVLADLRFYVGEKLRLQLAQPLDLTEPVEVVDAGPELAALLFDQRAALVGEGGTA